MAAVAFTVRGSTGNLYEIRAKGRGSDFTITCTCEGGENGLQCKHRAALLQGVIADLVEGNVDDVRALADSVKGSKLEAALSSLEDAEGRLAKAKKEVSAAKKRVGAAMLGR